MPGGNNTSKGKKQSSEKHNHNGLAKEGVGAIVKIVIEELKKAPPWLSGFVVIVGLVAILVLVIAVSLVWKDQYDFAYKYGIIGILTLLAVAGIIALVIRRVYKPADSPSHGSPNLDIKWSRPMLKMPWDRDKLGDLYPRIEIIHSKAFMFLSEAKAAPDLQPDDIRVNVFLPDYNDSSEGEVCLLVMEPKLCKGMLGCSDENLMLRISQGVTGKVFREQNKQFVARALDAINRRQDFNDIYELTAEQKKQIHPQLKWIVSSPLNIKRNGVNRTIGVLSIDGLKHEIDKGILDKLAARVLAEVISFADELSKLPLVTAVVGVMEA